MGTFRFLLALAVALGHFGTIGGYHIMGGSMAVQCFFIISGFLISLILSQKYDASTAEGRWLFYSNRALRIFVPYWWFCLLILAMDAIVYIIIGGRIGADFAFAQYRHEMTLTTWIYLLFSNVFILTQEWAMWLAYDHGGLTWVWNSDLHKPHLGSFMVISQAWSMSLELMFYAIAPFLVRRHWLTLVAIIVTTYLLRSLALAHGFHGSGFAYRFFPFEIGLFLGGVLSHRGYMLVNSRGLMRFPVSLTVSAMFLGVLLVHQYLDRLNKHTFFILVVLALPSLFHVSQRIRSDRWLGELSYPIYLVHAAMMSLSWVVAPLFGPFENPAWVVLGAVIATILVSIVYVHLIDTPFERWRQRRARPKADRSLQPQQVPIPV